MSKKPYKKRPKEESPEEPAVPDRRALEKMLADLGRLLEEQEFESLDEANGFLEQLMASGQPLPTPEPQTPVEEAQALMYEAWEAPTAQKRIRLARKALSISEDCADAYVLLAEESARSLEEAKELYEAGVHAGERALGEEAFAKYEGHFWGVMETRPYMRAREGLAACLWILGQSATAIHHYQEMLRLNPGDNQGIRYILLRCLFDEGRDQEAEELLAAYPDDAAATWLYTSALLTFRKEGSSRRANRRLRQALEFNPHVPAYLLGRQRLPQEQSHYIGLGDETEAADYVADAGHFWLREPGAIEWLRKRAE